MQQDEVPGIRPSIGSVEHDWVVCLLDLVSELGNAFSGNEVVATTPVRQSVFDGGCWTLSFRSSDSWRAVGNDSSLITDKNVPCR